MSGQQKKGYKDVYPTKWYVAVFAASFLLLRSYLEGVKLRKLRGDEVIRRLDLTAPKIPIFPRLRECTILLQCKAG